MSIWDQNRVTMGTPKITATSMVSSGLLPPTSTRTNMPPPSAAAPYLDPYEHAAAFGHDLPADEKNFAMLQYDQTSEVYAFIRAVPSRPDRPVVIHLVNWSDQPLPLNLRLDPQRLLAADNLDITLLTPTSYNHADHVQAEKQKDYSRLLHATQLPIIRESSALRIDIPQLRTWAILVVKPLYP